MTTTYNDWRRHRGHDGKLTYPSEHVARNAALLIAWKHDDEPMTAYECEHCDGWHIGHDREEQ